MLHFLKEDVDKMFSYHSRQQVKISNPKLGMTSQLLSLLIIIYFVFYVFLIDKGYLEYEAAKGVTVTHVRGDAVATSSKGKKGNRYFSADQITYPGLENGNVMVATSVAIHKQKRGVCEDKNSHCSSAADCLAGGTCLASGICKEPSWCPDGQDLETYETYELETSGLSIWVKSAIMFAGLKKEKIFTGEFSKPIPFPQPGFNVYTVKDILGLCKPPIRFEEISELGAAIEVNFIWDCNVDQKDCEPRVQVQRVDSKLDAKNSGFGLSYPQYTGPDTRELHQVGGIRFFFRTMGTGETVSILAIGLKVSTGLMLLGLAPLITDMWMLKCMKAKSDTYFAWKYDMSEDFGEAFERLEAEKAAGGSAGANDDGDDVDQEEMEWRRRMEDD